MVERGERSGMSVKTHILGDSTNKLKIAIQIISAVANIHTFESYRITSIVHQDVCCHQIMLIDGVYKIGDFHVSQFLQHKHNADTPGGFDTCPVRGTQHAKVSFIWLGFVFCWCWCWSCNERM
jgi:hypothetical protein